MLLTYTLGKFAATQRCKKTVTKLVKNVEQNEKKGGSGWLGVAHHHHDIIIMIIIIIIIIIIISIIHTPIDVPIEQRVFEAHLSGKINDS